jgi:small membrane protein
MFIQIVLIIFLFFAASRVYLQWRAGNLKIVSFIFWVTIFCGAILGILQPDLTTRVAKMVGIGRGADVVIYFSVAILFYLLFRIYIYIENLRHEISDLVSQLALKQDKKFKKSKKK